MRTLEIQIYKFNELSNKAKEKAINWYFETMNFESYDEGNNELLKEHGFINSDIQFSGFYSQGDGASFTADIDMDKFLIGKYACLKDVDFELKIARINSNYSHERTKRVEAHIYHATDDECELITELEREVEELRIDLCHRIYRNIEADYDYQTSLEYIAEYMDANDYEFNEKGEII